MNTTIKLTEQAEKDAKSYLVAFANIGKIKAGKLLATSFKKDAALNRFLTRDVKAGAKLFFDKKTLANTLEAVEAYGITSEAEKRALIVSILKSSATADIAEMRGKYEKLVLNEEQQKALDSKLKEYEQAWESGINANLMQIGLYLGAVTVVKEHEAVSV